MSLDPTYQIGHQLTLMTGKVLLLTDVVKTMTGAIVAQPRVTNRAKLAASGWESG